MFNLLPFRFVTACGQTTGAVFFAVTGQFYLGMGQLSDVNLEILKSRLPVMWRHVSQQPVVEEQEHWLAWYQSHLVDVCSTLGGCAQIADEHYMTLRREAHAFVDAALKNAPPGSNVFAGVLLAPLTATESSYEATRRTVVREVFDLADRACHAVRIATASGSAWVTAAIARGAPETHSRGAPRANRPVAYSVSRRRSIASRRG